MISDNQGNLCTSILGCYMQLCTSAFGIFFHSVLVDVKREKEVGKLEVVICGERNDKSCHKTMVDFHFAAIIFCPQSPS